MIVLTCPECESTHIKKYEGKMTEKGYDWFSCEKCKHNFPLKNTSYREESNVYD